MLPLSPFSICNGPWHPLYSTYVIDSPHVQPLSRSSSCSIHFFTQSSSSFRNTWPYQRSLFCCNTNAMSSMSPTEQYLCASYDRTGLQYRRPRVTDSRCSYVWSQITSSTFATERASPALWCSDSQAVYLAVLWAWKLMEMYSLRTLDVPYGTDRQTDRQKASRVASVCVPGRPTT